MQSRLIIPVILILITVVAACNNAVESTSENFSEIATQKPNRVSDGLIFLYTFNEGSGSELYDSSGSGVALDARIFTPKTVAWIDGGLELVSGSEIITSTFADKIKNSVNTSESLTLEAWVKPANTVQSGPARIFSISGDTTTQSIMLGQEADVFHVRLRTTQTDSKGLPELQSKPGSATTALTHIVFTWSATDGQSVSQADLYINGQWESSISRGGNTTNSWEDHELRIGFEDDTFGPATDFWLGELYLVAVYDRKLTDVQIQQNYQAGSE